MNKNATHILKYTKRVKEIIISVLRPLVKNHIYTAISGLAKGLKRKSGLGFITRYQSIEKSSY